MGARRVFFFDRLDTPQVALALAVALEVGRTLALLGVARIVALLALRLAHLIALHALVHILRKKKKEPPTSRSVFWT